MRTRNEKDISYALSIAEYDAGMDPERHVVLKVQDQATHLTDAEVESLNVWTSRYLGRARGPKVTHRCYLCMVSRWKRDDATPRFMGYRTYSSEPWNLTNTSELFSAIFMTEADSFQEALDEMIAAVRSLSQSMPFWASVWPWIDPSQEGHEKRLQLFLELQKENV